MKKILPFLTLFILSFTSLVSQNTIPTNPNFTGDLVVITRLLGANEVPAVSSPGVGHAAVTFDAAMTTARLQCTVTGLTSAVTGAHIHTGKAGVNGGVLFNFTSNLVNGKIDATFAVTKENVRALLAGDYYLNIHTSMNTGGEVRGQLALDAPEAYTVIASGANEIPANTTTGQALASVLYYPNSNVIELRGLATGLTGNITGVHFHKGFATENGTVVQNLATFLTETALNGRFAAGTYVSDLRAGGIYLNIHTAANGGGEIRGQLVPVKGIHFDGWLSGLQEVPQITTTGRGLFFGTLNGTLDSVTLQSIQHNLTGVVTAAHFHTAPLGINGGVALNFGTAIAGTRINVSTPVAVTSTIASNLLKGNLYVNVHTAANSGGEIRGQLYKSAFESYSFAMCQSQEVSKPVNAGNAEGNAYFSFGRGLNEAYLAVVINGLSGPAVGAHIHTGAKGANGGVVYNFTSSLANNRAFVTLDTSVFPKTLLSLITSGNAYVNVHTANNTGGEVRGQIEKVAGCTISTSTNNFDKLDSYSVRPNPAAEYIQVTNSEQQSNTNNDTKYLVYDISGRLQITSLDTRINVSSLSKGIYIIKIEGHNTLGVVKFTKL